MPRAATKKDLIVMASEGYEKLMDVIDSMSLEEQNMEFLFEDRDRNIRDVLVHLYEWHQLLLNWVESNKKGDNKPFIPEPYNFRTYGAMNIELIWKKHQNTSYDEAKKLVAQSHKEVMKLIESYTNEELFERKHFSWTGTSTLGSYCISTTSSHYDWAVKKIKKQKKEIKNKV